MNVRDASHLPVRTSDATYFWNVSGKSMITQPFGLPPTSWPISLSKFGGSGFQEMFTPTFPPSYSNWVTKSCLSATPKASLRAPMLTVAPLPNASITAWASTVPCSVSEGYARQR
jgi:hypothetical protein